MLLSYVHEHQNLDLAKRLLCIFLRNKVPQKKNSFFSLFAGLVVASNLLLMITWVPAALVISQRYGFCCCFSSCCSCNSGNEINTLEPVRPVLSAPPIAVHHHNPAFANNNNNNNNAIEGLSSNNSPSVIPFDNCNVTSPPSSPNIQQSDPTSLRSSSSQSPPHSPRIPEQISFSDPVKDSVFMRSLKRACDIYAKFTNDIFDQFLPWLVLKPKAVWLVLLLALSGYSGYVVFYHPGLNLPDTPDFQLFDRNHVFERYDLEHKLNFWFVRNIQSSMANQLPIRIVWGLKPVDNSDHLNPASESTLELDPTFDIADPLSQDWLLQFCRNLLNQSFYRSTFGPMLPNCFIQTFKAWMSDRKCKDGSKNRYPCCSELRFPYPRWVFNQCIGDAMKDLYDTPLAFRLPGDAGPKFNKTSGRIAALVVEYDSTYLFSHSFYQMHKFFTEVPN